MHKQRGIRKKYFIKVQAKKPARSLVANITISEYDIVKEVVLLKKMTHMLQWYSPEYETQMVLSRKDLKLYVGELKNPDTPEFQCKLISINKFILPYFKIIEDAKLKNKL